jgi:hypothetical protein
LLIKKKHYECDNSSKKLKRDGASIKLHSTLPNVHWKIYVCGFIASNGNLNGWCLCLWFGFCFVVFRVGDGDGYFK